MSESASGGEEKGSGKITSTTFDLAVIAPDLASSSTSLRIAALKSIDDAVKHGCTTYAPLEFRINQR